MAEIIIDGDRKTLKWQKSKNLGGISSLDEATKSESFTAKILSRNTLQINGQAGMYEYLIYDMDGKLLSSNTVVKNNKISDHNLPLNIIENDRKLIMLLFNKSHQIFTTLVF